LKKLYRPTHAIIFEGFFKSTRSGKYGSCDNEDYYLANNREGQNDKITLDKSDELSEIIYLVPLMQTITLLRAGNTDNYNAENNDRHVYH